MSFGKMNTFISLVEKQFTQDDEGFKTETDVTVAEVRAYREGRHGSEKWANMASFSTATDLFQFRVIPGVTVTTDMRILCDGHTFEITSVEDIKGRGMYLEAVSYTHLDVYKRQGLDRPQGLEESKPLPRYHGGY